jgi:hypothetical protein
VISLFTSDDNLSSLFAFKGEFENFVFKSFKSERKKEKGHWEIIERSATFSKDKCDKNKEIKSMCGHEKIKIKNKFQIFWKNLMCSQFFLPTEGVCYSL